MEKGYLPEVAFFFGINPYFYCLKKNQPYYEKNTSINFNYNGYKRSRAGCNDT